MLGVSQKFAIDTNLEFKRGCIQLHKLHVYRRKPGHVTFKLRAVAAAEAKSEGAATREFKNDV